MDILHAMKDALMKYETIDAPQIDDLMARRDVRPPAGWEDPAPTILTAMAPACASGR
jgi:cell division protease FtsH